MTISEKIEELIKKKIIELGLVKSGRMLHSISVKESQNGYSVSCVDYFEPLDKRYNIVESVVNSPELVLFIQRDLTKEIEDSFNKN